jgi:hypothetical protein
MAHNTSVLSQARLVRGNSDRWLCRNVKSFGVVSLRDSRKSALGVSCTSVVGAS